MPSTCSTHAAPAARHDTWERALRALARGMLRLAAAHAASRFCKRAPPGWPSAPMRRRCGVTWRAS